jgi:hypothetical protein
MEERKAYLYLPRLSQSHSVNTKSVAFLPKPPRRAESVAHWLVSRFVGDLAEPDSHTRVDVIFSAGTDITTLVDSFWCSCHQYDFVLRKTGKRQYCGLRTAREGL